MSGPACSGQPHWGIHVLSVTCSCGKQGYRERAGAKKVIKEMRRTGKLRHNRVNAYLCQSGTGYWHVGHGSPRGRPNLNSPDLRFLGEDA